MASWETRPDPLGQYLFHSYLYYIHDTNIIDDGDYDDLCSHLLEHHGQYKDHKWYSLIDIEALKAGSGFHLKAEDYPPQVAFKAATFYL